jgi:hypothetical protein
MGHAHQHLHLKARQLDGDFTTIDGTVYSVDFVTAEPTFDGVIGGYTTLDGGAPSSQNAGQTLNAPQTAEAPSARPSQASNSIPAAATADSSATASQQSPSYSFATPSQSASNAASNVAAGPASTSSSSASSSSAGESGMSTGAKAGVAIGIIAVIGLIAALLLWFIGKKKKEKRAREGNANDEKTTFGASRNAIGMQTNPTSTSAAAPRLSIRPMSRNLLGDFGFGGGNRRSAGNMLNNISEQPQRGPSPQPPRAQSPAENPFADPQNPFADPEKAAFGAAALGAAAGAPRHAPGPHMANSRAPAFDEPMAPPQAPNPDRIAFTGSWPDAPSGYEPPAKSLPPPKIMQPQSAVISEPDDLPIMGAPTPSMSQPSPAPSSQAAFGAAAAAAGIAAGAAAMSRPKDKESVRREPARPQQHPQPRPQEAPREQPREQPRQMQREPSPEPVQQEPRNAPREAPREAPRDAMPSPGPAPSPAFAAAASDMPGSPGSTASSQSSQGNVYRVMMDFVPSMDDELDLKAGSLVRLLHEYDDGWVS